MCSLPITSLEITNNIPVCPAKMRPFEFIVELIVRQISHNKFYDNHAIIIRNRGDMVTGLLFRVSPVIMQEGLSAALCHKLYVMISMSFS